MRITRRSVLGMMLASAAHAAGPPARERAIVLFSTEADPDLSLATLELRKLYLGFTVRHDGHLLRPIRNRSDETLDAVFLQGSCDSPDVAGPWSPSPFSAHHDAGRAQVEARDRVRAPRRSAAFLRGW